MSKIIKNMIFYLILIVIPLSLLYFLAYPTYLKSKKINKSITFNEDKIEALSHLATLEIELSDFYEERKIAKKNWIRKDFFIRGFMMFKGRAKIGVNLSKIKVKILDKERKVIKITLPAPEIIFLKLHTKMFDEIDWQDIKSQDKVNFSIAINKPKFDIELDENVTSLYLKDEDKKIHKDILIEYSKEAEDNLKTAAENNIYKARKQAEEFITEYLKQFDYTVKKVYWRDLTKKSLNKETLNNINLDVSSKLILCNEENNNLLKNIKFR